MPEYLDDDWIAAMDAALSAHEGLRAATASLRLAVRTVVTDVPGRGAVAYVVELDHGSNRVRRVEATGDDGDVCFTTDHDTARGIRDGRTSAQAAFLAGRLRLGGDARVLTENHTVLAEVDDLFGSVRTEWADEAVDA